MLVAARRSRLKLFGQADRHDGGWYRQRKYLIVRRSVPVARRFFVVASIMLRRMSPVAVQTNRPRPCLSLLNRPLQ
jgi:hypothetical protein